MCKFFVLIKTNIGIIKKHEGQLTMLRAIYNCLHDHWTVLIDVYPHTRLYCKKKLPKRIIIGT